MSHPRPESIPTLYLVGYRGSGKSIVGDLLARQLERELIDTDREIEARTGKTIREIFAQDGELHFRDLEEAEVGRCAGLAASGTRLVVALGGGAVLRRQSVDRLRATGRVVWLAAAAPELRRRILADAGSSAARPALTGASAADEIESVLERRLPIYAAAAHHRIETEGAGPEEVVRRVLGAVEAAAT